ncbi:hypothetical protein [Streptomyces lasalocidi]|uniref:Uncharacterized protein n=1 Tax=Streptomyces lasalocidi TaxID=324833 RepID=A0A4U5W3Y1_STRLS|nr:hypothetical protein [Streptomyces lasalocidi]TKS96136.1 hypothetical protein E4U91_35815 [Streptomyces lasalocidi]
MVDDTGVQPLKTLHEATEAIHRRISFEVMSASRARIPMPAEKDLINAAASLQSMLEGLNSGMPHNWQTERLLYRDMIRVAAAGVPLAWVPPADVIRWLLAAGNESSRLKVIEDCSSDILASCHAALKAASGDQISTKRELLEECVFMAEQGMWPGVQALAVNASYSLVHQIFIRDPEWLTAGNAYDFTNVVSDGCHTEFDASISDCFRKAALFLPFARVLDNSGAHRTASMGLNWHSTVIEVNPTQYSKCNALIALMLAVSVLREIHNCGY